MVLKDPPLGESLNKVRITTNVLKLFLEYYNKTLLRTKRAEKLNTNF